MTIHELVIALEEVMGFGMEGTEVVLFVHDGPAEDGKGFWYRLPIDHVRASTSELGDEFFGAIEIVAKA